MNKKLAAAMLLLVCAVLVIVLLIKLVNSLVGVIIFAVALAFFGLSSRGFRK